MDTKTLHDGKDGAVGIFNDGKEKAEKFEMLLAIFKQFLNSFRMALREFDLTRLIAIKWKTCVKMATNEASNTRHTSNSAMPDSSVVKRE